MTKMQSGRVVRLPRKNSFSTNHLDQLLNPEPEPAQIKRIASVPSMEQAAAKRPPTYTDAMPIASYSSSYPKALYSGYYPIDHQEWKYDDEEDESLALTVCFILMATACVASELLFGQELFIMELCMSIGSLLVRSIVVFWYILIPAMLAFYLASVLVMRFLNDVERQWPWKLNLAVETERGSETATETQSYVRSQW
eukprot:CAMPEP_0197515118 /NCGR_PEP_ID=MMETSP1318-20131121/343_1 /TAXON_ID=552666 /ORGANISM="Partenskyella glossopodia, Strain RCC365" /LENGTH=196 /DNA_ID=CAMNT_0043063397 /DNA_START=85 /DNA_END=672 /DNA_ORIENTATION=+